MEETIHHEEDFTSFKPANFHEEKSKQAMVNNSNNYKKEDIKIENNTKYTDEKYGNYSAVNNDAGIFK